MQKNIARICLIALLLIGTFISASIQTTRLTTPVAYAAVDPSWDKSSLQFTGDCQADNCTHVIQAQLCNTGTGDMASTSTYEVYYAASGNPKSGSVVATGTVPALAAGQCTTLTYDTTGIAGNYMFHAFQRPGHPGQGDLWSTQCVIGACVQTSPSPTPSPSTDPSPSPSSDPGSPTPTPGVGGSSGCQTSLANDRLQCGQSNFDAVMDIVDNGSPKKDVLVHFSYNGSSKDAHTDDNGRAKVSFDFNGNGSVTANPDSCAAQSMNITVPACSDNSNGQVLGATTGKVLGASTLASTGMADETIALIAVVSGIMVTTMAGFGYAKAVRKA